ncbi:hypothetical protein CAJAP_08605 [Camponotus japonicus]
MLNRL